jgi:hypothetical protein
LWSAIDFSAYEIDHPAGVFFLERTLFHFLNERLIVWCYARKEAIYAFTNRPPVRCDAVVGIVLMDPPGWLTKLASDWY